MILIDFYRKNVKKLIEFIRKNFWSILSYFNFSQKLIFLKSNQSNNRILAPAVFFTLCIIIYLFYVKAVAEQINSSGAIGFSSSDTLSRIKAKFEVNADFESALILSCLDLSFLLSDILFGFC